MNPCKAEIDRLRAALAEATTMLMVQLEASPTVDLIWWSCGWTGGGSKPQNEAQERMFERGVLMRNAIDIKAEDTSRIDAVVRAAVEMHEGCQRARADSSPDGGSFSVSALLEAVKALTDEDKR